MTERLVVIGGDAAGMTAASRVRRLRPNRDDLEIMVFERGTRTSYSACGIPYWVAGDVADPEALIARTPQEHRERGIDVWLRTEVERIDLDAREIHTRDLRHGGTTRVSYDQLLIATGSTPKRPELPGIHSRGVYGVQTLDDGEALLDGLRLQPRHAVVIGGGYIGVEMAEAMVRRGLEVTMIDQAAEPMSTLDPDMGAEVRSAMEKLGIQLVTGAPVVSLEADEEGRVSAVVTPSGRYEADVVVLGLGVRPATELARAAGLPLGGSGGLRTDLRMRVVDQAGRPIEGIWAAGDCVEVLDLVSSSHRHVALGTHANKQGRVAGSNLGGGYATFPGVVGTAISRVCGLEIARTGLREVDADRAGYSYTTATIASTTRASYFPGAADVTVKVLAERITGRLLGAQIVGGEGSAKRIDTLAVALWNRMTVSEITSLDLGYAPPFSPVWDPVLIAARKAADAVTGGTC